MNNKARPRNETGKTLGVEGRGHAMTQAGAIIRYLETLILSGGDHDGEPFKVLAWERRFIQNGWGKFAAAFLLALSIARGNGKSCLNAGLGCCVVDPDGPLFGPRREVDVIASSFEQGRTIFEDVLRFLGAKHDLSDQTTWKRHDSVNHALLEHRPSGARLRCLGSDPARMHGLRPFLCLADEPAQWDVNKRDRALAAITTGLGKTPGSRLICLGTKPSSPDHWFSKMLAGGAGYAQIHAADKDDDPFKVATWRKANPSLDHLPSLRQQIEREANDAKKDGDLLAAFKAFRENLGTNEINEAFLIEPEAWARAEGEAETIGPYVLAFDLGQSEAMSAAAGFFLNTRALACFACWPELPSLEDREKKDAVEDGLYRKMFARHELMVSGRRVANVTVLVREALERWGSPVAVVCDRYRVGELTQILEAETVPVCDLVARGQGYRDGGEDTRLFKKAVLSGRVVAAPSLLLRDAMRNVRTVSDPAGNTKIAKRSERSGKKNVKDDAASAAVLAVAHGQRLLGWTGEDHVTLPASSDDLLIGSVLAA